MVLIEDWLPPSREHWELVSTVWKFFPAVTLLQWVVSWYGQGKTSVQSRFNIPGKWGWAAMETPGFVTLLYIMFTLPARVGIEQLPWQNWAMAGMFATHYVYRALIAPLFLNPSMSPIHLAVCLMAFSFQISNATALGGWLAAYGPVTASAWSRRSTATLGLGAAIWAGGLAGNIWHDDALRELRRKAAREQAEKEEGKKGKEAKKSVEKVYIMPEAGLFKYILYPHYLCEWIEWGGFWMFGGASCIPARSFVVNEVSTMWPRARQGYDWYVMRFGKDKVGNRGAILPIPGV